jgi:pantoate--beta-alanine ligase
MSLQLPVVIETPDDMIAMRKSFAAKSIGFVPTMGALHQGHAELLKRARAENEIVILSIFVNPTQFNNPDDLNKYPKTFSADLEIAAQMGVDSIFAPTEKVMYPDGYRFRLNENLFSKELCGAHRPGHFDGVLTVVMKLFQIVRPARAYFGEKDYQQLSLIQDMVAAFFMDLEIIPVATVREVDGLAMSSRNTRLTSEQRKLAPKIYEISKAEKFADDVRMQLSKIGFDVDYVEDKKNRRFIAAKLGDVRLIDNVEI